MASMTEAWVPVPEWGHLYEVSSQGRVRRIAWGKTHNRVIKARRYKNGYMYVNLCDGPVTKWATVHRLVCAAFHGSPDQNATVNHKDGDKSNNAASNVEWATLSENIRHAFDVLRRRPAVVKSYILTDQAGTKVHVHNLRQFCIQQGFHEKLMYGVASGRKRQYKGWTCERGDSGRECT